MAEEIFVILRRDDNQGLGFSLLGKPGLPPIIYNILEDSPAADSEVEVGDVILKVNETDVIRYSTKEVLKCLRLSSDPVTLKIKRDPKIKATVRKHLLSTNNSDKTGSNLINSVARPEPSVHQSSHVLRTNGSCPLPEEEPLLLETYHHHQQQQQQQQHRQQQQQQQQQQPQQQQENERLQWEPLAAVSNDQQQQQQQPPKFEAFMMTGEHILNISRVSQSTTSIIPKQQKKVDNLRYHNSHTHHLRHQPQQQQQQQQHNSVPNSPNMDLGVKHNHHHSYNKSANTSPVSANRRDVQEQLQGDKYCTTTNNFVRTSRSEDQLQGGSISGGNNDQINIMSNVNIDDDDITSSLNTLLDTRPDNNSEISGGSGSSVGDSDRIVWTYNAPMTEQQQQQLLLQQQQQQQHEQHKLFCHTLSNGSNSSQSQSSPTSSSPLHSGGSPASPTSVSSSVMSSQSGSRRFYNNGLQPPLHGANNGGVGGGNSGGGGGGGGYGGYSNDFSVSEAISNISSPDYHDDDSMGIRDCVMEISDHSDSDSTLLVSEPRQQQKRGSVSGSGGGGGGVGSSGSGGTSGGVGDAGGGDHRIVIQVKGPDKDVKGKINTNYCDNSVRNRIENSNGYQISGGDLLLDHGDNEDGVWEKSPSPQSSEDESDVESLHSFHYSPKAVDLPSAIRLAKRLYGLDGFKKSDVSRHLSKNNDFSRAVAEEYLKYFNFENDTLDIALRKFLKQFSLTGETQERERVLVHFSKRFLDCNPGSFNSQDAVHTLTCAIMLLNTDLHGQNITRKMTCSEFIENLAGLNEGENFPREVLKQLYHAIKNYPLEWALDDEESDGTLQMQQKNNNEQLGLGANPFLDVPISSNAVEYKKGYVMRKSCYEANGKRTPFHKRSWKMFYCTLRDLVLYLHKDENGFRKNQMGDNLHNAIRIHHALATKASDYTKKQYVFRLQTADQAEYLFQTSDSKELQSWIDTINFVCASFSAPPLEAAVGSQKKFQRPLLPCSHTKLNLREQLRDHEERVLRLENELEEYRKSPPEKGAKSLVVQNYKEKEAYLTYEIKRYRTYAYMLRSRMSQFPEMGISLVDSIGEVDEAAGVTILDGSICGGSGGGAGGGGGGGSGGGIVPPPLPERPSPSTNRYSYRQAIYNRNVLNGDADIG